MKFELLKADKELFAVYHTMHSNADIEMWYDWKKRLQDTMWTEECYFVTTSEGEKIGGLILLEDRISFPFLISPFSDRVAFWAFILKNFKRKAIRGVLNDDAKILPMFSYVAKTCGQVMCRPADYSLKCELNENFICRQFDLSDSETVAQTLQKSYHGSFLESINGTQTLEQSLSDIDYLSKAYGNLSLSRLVADKNSGEIVGVALCGELNGYIEIGELCVLPQYRGRGIAQFLLTDAVKNAYGKAPYVKLFVRVGNDAQYLYHKLGFVGGPKFTNFLAFEA